MPFGKGPGKWSHQRLGVYTGPGVIKINCPKYTQVYLPWMPWKLATHPLNIWYREWGPGRSLSEKSQRWFSSLIVNFRSPNRMPLIGQEMGSDGIQGIWFRVIFCPRITQPVGCEVPLRSVFKPQAIGGIDCDGWGRPWVTGLGKRHVFPWCVRHQAILSFCVSADLGFLGP